LKVSTSKPSHTPNRYAPCRSLVRRLNICVEKQKEFCQRTFKKFYQVM